MVFEFSWSSLSVWKDVLVDHNGHLFNKKKRTLLNVNPFLEWSRMKNELFFLHFCWFWTSRWLMGYYICLDWWELFETQLFIECIEWWIFLDGIKSFIIYLFSRLILSYFNMNMCQSSCQYCPRKMSIDQWETDQGNGHDCGSDKNDSCVCIYQLNNINTNLDLAEISFP